MMGGRPRLDQFRPVFPKRFSGRENPWKMSASWFLIDVASPEESGFSLETRCPGEVQQGSSEDLCRVSPAIRAVPSEEGFVQSKCLSILKSMDMAWSSLAPLPLTPTRVRRTQRICFPSWHHCMHGSGPLGEMQAVPWLPGWLVELYSWFSVFRDVREPRALADLWNGLCFIPLGISLSKAHCRAKE